METIDWYSIFGRFWSGMICEIAVRLVNIKET
jgi:hypothetical protein